jgi:hypothetical protein
MKRIVSILVVLLSVNIAAAASVSWYRNDDLRIALAYGARWRPVAAAEAASLKVEWNGKQGGLITTCYLQAYEGGLGKLSADELQVNAEQISASLMRNAKKRFPVAHLISSQKLIVDSWPVLFLVRDMHGSNLGKPDLKAWIIVTSWLNREINFECGSPVPFQFPGHPMVAEVEAEVVKVMRTLHFER